MASPRQRYNATVRVVSIVSVPVTGASLEEASARAQDLQLDDLIEVKGENLDYSIRIVGVDEFGGWDTN